MTTQYKKNVFIYIEWVKRQNIIYHTTFPDVDQTRVDFPYEYQMTSNPSTSLPANPDRTVTKFELECCKVIEKHFDYYYRTFDYGSFFALPLVPDVVPLIGKCKSFQHKNYLHQEIKMMHVLHKAIGIELAYEAYQDYVKRKREFSLPHLSQDISSHVLFDYVYDEIHDMSALLHQEDFLFEEIEALPVEWKCIVKYNDGVEREIDVSNRYNYYDDENHYAIGLFVGASTELVGAVKMQFIFRYSNLIFPHIGLNKVYYRSEWLDCPDYQVLLDAKRTIDNIDWPQDD